MNTNAAGGFPHVILASASPRRLDLLRQAGIEPEVEPSHVVEVIRSTKPDEVVMELSRQKAEDIASCCCSSLTEIFWESQRTRRMRSA